MISLWFFVVVVVVVVAVFFSLVINRRYGTNLQTNLKYS